MTATSTDDGVQRDDSSTAVLPVPTTPATPPAPAETTAQPPAPAPRAGETGQTEASVAGAGLIAEAELAIEERRWRDALRVLGAVDSIGASSVHTDGLLAVAATHLHKNKTAAEAVSRIEAHPPTADSHRALAEVAMARHGYQIADGELRSAMELSDGDVAQDWARLAACYAGLGWFDEATDCLDRAETLGASDRDRWLVGRAVNRWALSKTWATGIGVALFLVVGLLSIAVSITVPFIVRELRTTQLDERYAALADDAWADERWLRLAHAGAVVIVVVLWAIAMQFR